MYLSVFVIHLVKYYQNTTTKSFEKKTTENFNASANQPIPSYFGFVQMTHLQYCLLCDTYMNLVLEKLSVATRKF